MKIPFIGGAYEGRSSNVSPETCLNMFYEKGVAGESLVGMHGYEAVIGQPQWEEGDEVRGGIAYDNRAWFVIGNKFGYWDAAEIKAGEADTRFKSVGTINTNSGMVSMAHNGTRPGANQQIMIVDGKSGYIWDNSAETLTEITDTDFVPTDTVAFIDGYFIFPQKGGSDRFWITNLYDGSAIDSTDFSTAEGSPDPIQNIIVDNRQVFLFGTESLEVWYNSGDTDNTFQRFQGGFKQHGCAAKFSPARFDNSIIWLARNDRGDGQVVRLAEGYQPRVVSTPEIDYQISTYETIDDAYGYAYQFEGHEFYVLNFPTVNKTWVYDASTQQWHTRARLPITRSNTPEMEGLRAHVSLGNNVNLFGDKYGYVYRAVGHRSGFYGATHFGNVFSATGAGTGESGTRWRGFDAQPMERTTVPVSNEEKRVRISSLQLDVNEGTFRDYSQIDNEFRGTSGTEAIIDNSYAWLQYSKNGGHTWTNETKRDMGSMGEFFKRAIWRRLGWGRNWIFRIKFTTMDRPVVKGLIAKLYGEP